MKRISVVDAIEDALDIKSSTTVFGSGLTGYTPMYDKHGGVALVPIPQQKQGKSFRILSRRKA